MDAIQKLNQLNFGDLLVLEHPDIAAYSYRDYKENDHKHPKVIGYCTECERKGCSNSLTDPGFSLKNMSHGAHSEDFLAALRQPVDVTGWHDEPVLFVYESPSVDHGFYEAVEHQGQNKRPSKEWYWIHRDQDVRGFPDNFTGRTYGPFVLSAILTFHLKNAYMTNLVKCGMNTDDGKQFRGLAAFQPTCVQSCIDRYLRHEIEIFNPRVIFAVGAAANYWLSSVRGNIPTCQLPHPAGGRRGFKNAYFRVLYFWLVTLELQKAGIIQTAEAEQLASMFIREYKDP